MQFFNPILKNFIILIIDVFYIFKFSIVTMAFSSNFLHIDARILFRIFYKLKNISLALRDTHLERAPNAICNKTYSVGFNHYAELPN